MADNSNTLQLTLQVKDDGSIVIDQVSGKIKGMGYETEKAASKSSSTLGGLKESWLAVAAGATAGYFAIKKSIDTLNSFVTAAAEAQQIESRMAFQIEATGIQYDKVKDSIDAYATSVLKSTRFSDEAARQGLGKMMRYTDDLGAALKNTKLAMDISIQTGMDLDSVIGLLGMAMGGEIEVWNRWSLEIRNANAVLGENASASEKSEFSLRSLNKQFGGAAQKDAQTYAGSVAQTNNEWQKTKELLGEKLLPYFQMWNAGVKSIVNDVFPKEEEALKKEIQNLNDLIEDYKLLALEQPQVAEQVEKATERRGAAEKKLAEIRNKTKTDAVGAIKAEQDRANAAKRGYEENTKYASVLDEANYGYKMLGITSTSVLDEQTSKTVWAVEKIKKAWEEGKAGPLDYVNALKAAKDALDKFKPAEDMQKRMDAEETYQKALSRREPTPLDPDLERQRQVGAALDKYIQTMKDLEAQKPLSIIDIPKLEADVAKSKAEAEKLYGSFDKPIEPEMDTSKAIIQMDGIESKYNILKNTIEGNPIQIKIDRSSGISSGGGEGISFGSPSDIEANVDFTATGLSPKISLGSAFDKIESRFKTISEKSRAMEAVIEFQGLSNQLRDFQKKYDLITESATSWVQTMKRFSLLVDPNQLEYIKNLNAAQEDLFYQMKTYKLQMAEQKYLMGLPGSEEEFYSIFKSKFHTPVYQHGTPYVPETGLALVHRGERITPANQNFSMGAITLNFTINGGGGDPKRVAEEFAHVLRYDLSGVLKEAIRKAAKR